MPISGVVSKGKLYILAGKSQHVLPSQLGGITVHKTYTGWFLVGGEGVGDYIASKTRI